MINSQSKIIVMTQKGKRTVRRYRKMYSDSNYAINLSKGTDNGILNESISKKNEAIPSNFDTEKTASYNYIKAGILVILILWCFISFLWEAFINHNKAALLIWLFLCVVFTIFSRRS